MGVAPLYLIAMDPDEAWGVHAEIACSCDARLRLWDTRCKACKKKNTFPRLLKKRKRVERLLDRQIELKFIPRLFESLVFLEMASKYHAVLGEVMRRPFPQYQKKEDLNMFMTRVVKFFPSMFKSTSPKRIALEISSSMKRSSTAISLSSFKQSDEILDGLLGATSSNVYGNLADEQAHRIVSDLLNAAKQYMELLKALQLGHKRMVAAYEPVRGIFQRQQESKGARGLWNKARLKLRPVGQCLRLPTAVWKDEVEHENLKRFDTQLDRFIKQIGWFLDKSGELQDSYDVMINAYKLSLRKYLLLSIAERYMSADTLARPVLVKRALSSKGVGSWLWRLFFGYGAQ